VILTGCSDEGGEDTIGPGPGVKQNPMTAGFQAIADATDRVFTMNEPVYESIAFLGSKIGASFSKVAFRVNRDTESTGQQSCIPANLQGTVFRYDINQGDYVPTADPGAPPLGVRYVLYQVDGSGNPLPSLDEIGFFDAECRGQLPRDSLTVTVTNMNAVAILEIELRTFQLNSAGFIFGSSPGTMRDPNGDVSVDVIASADGVEGQNFSDTFAVTGGLEVFVTGTDDIMGSVGRLDNQVSQTGSPVPVPPFFSFGAGANEFDENLNTTLWAGGFTMSVDEDSLLLNINSGLRSPLEFEDYVRNTNAVLACMSGLYLSPVVESASSDGGCATGVINTPVVLPPSALSAIQGGYVGLLEILDAMLPLWMIGLEILAPSSN
jgi:hypothetical protein